MQLYNMVDLGGGCLGAEASTIPYNGFFDHYKLLKYQLLHIELKALFLDYQLLTNRLNLLLT